MGLLDKYQSFRKVLRTSYVSHGGELKITGKFHRSVCQDTGEHS